LKKMSEKTIVVVGDVLLDHYRYGHCQRLSPEAPVPILHLQREEYRLGGAANVAFNIKTLGGKVWLIGISGQEKTSSESQAFMQLLRQYALPHHLHPFGKTIVKTRFISQQQQLLRLDQEEKVPSVEAKRFFETFISETVVEKIKEINLLLLSDYEKGTLIPELWISWALQQQIPILVDPKGMDFKKYTGATALTPNLSEFERIVGHCHDPHALTERGQALRKALDLEALIITLGEKGAQLLTAKESQHFPTQAREVFDVTGAGDTFIAALAVARSQEKTWAEACQLANRAAGIAVGKRGTSPVYLHELLEDSSEKIIYHLDDFLRKNLKQKGKKIVFTNGCFDLLHKGHVRYLKAAKALGDILIVAVNSDASIQRLKGTQRPIQPLADRLEIIASLQAVDYVIAFAEDTPLLLIKALEPDVLVKGGDYQVKDIVGYQEVTATGGMVCTIPFVDGQSTSQIIGKIKNS
jgi:D-beta-D-heptose 7-phosphate kinase/D-beta-D-heptose 1-phosphate adenosyltransferase